MPLCGATLDESGVPPWTRGTSGGVWGRDNLVWVVDPETHPGASRHPSEGVIFKGEPCNLLYLVDRFSSWVLWQRCLEGRRKQLRCARLVRHVPVELNRQAVRRCKPKAFSCM